MNQREIKFRAWDKNEKLMYDVIVLQRGEFIAVPVVGADGWELSKRKLSSVELMQFTGLHDKNGKEIYEGDVVRILYTDWPSNPAPNNEGLAEYKKSISDIGYVVWDDDRWQLHFGEGKYGDSYGSIKEGKHGEKEIIGNIYQNKDLLV